MKLLIVALWFLSSIYLGVGGYLALDASQPREVEYDGLKFQSPVEMYSFIKENSGTGGIPGIYTPFLWALYLPPAFLLIIAAAACGAIGGIVRLTRALLLDMMKKGSGPSVGLIALNPFFSLLIGLLTLAVAYVCPALLTTSEVNLRPVSLILLSFIAGVFSLEMYDKIADGVKTKFFQPGGGS